MIAELPKDGEYIVRVEDRLADNPKDWKPVRHGKIKYYAGSINVIPHFYCTCCHKVYPEHNANEYRFCPNCGAKMDEKSEVEK